MPSVQGPRTGSLPAVPHLQRRRRRAHREARRHHRAARHGIRVPHPAQGAGGSTPAGGTPGDLIISFQVQPDRFFRREGLDIVCDVPLNLAQVTLGTRLRVRTLDGKKVMLRIPAGTQPGRKFRIKGQGVEKNGQRGDQLVGVQVSVPNELTAEAQDVMKRFAEVSGMTY